VVTARPAGRGPEEGAPRPASSFTGGEAARARDIVLRQLAAAPRSRVELERALTRKEVEPEVARQVLDRFTEIQLVDDVQYAELVVRSQRASRGLARQGLAHELRRRGVDPHASELALATVGAEDELESARVLVAKRLPATARLERPVRVRRLVGMLARKGYDGGTAMRVVTEALAAEREAEALDEPHPEDPHPEARHPEARHPEDGPVDDGVGSDGAAEDEVGEGTVRPLGRRSRPGRGRGAFAGGGGDDLEDVGDDEDPDGGL
jgi:regulatory protein